MKTNGSAVEFFYNERKDVSVGFIKPKLINSKHCQRLFHDHGSNCTIASNLRKVTNAFEQTVSYARSFTRAFGYGAMRFVKDFYVEQLSRAFDYLGDLVFGIKIKMIDRTKPVAKWTRDASKLGCCANNREFWKVDSKRSS